MLRSVVRFHLAPLEKSWSDCIFWATKSISSAALGRLVCRADFTALTRVFSRIRDRVVAVHHNCTTRAPVVIAAFEWMLGRCIGDRSGRMMARHVEGLMAVMAFGSFLSLRAPGRHL